MSQQQFPATFSSLPDGLLYVGELQGWVLGQFVDDLLVVDPALAHAPQQLDCFGLVDAEEGEEVVEELVGELGVLVEVVVEVEEHF
jgi:hypothetical protein